MIRQPGPSFIRREVAPPLIAMLAGLAIVLAAWGPVLTSPGEIIQRDLVYPLFIDDALADFYPILGADGRTALQYLSMMPIFAPAIGASQLLGVSTGGLIRALVVGQALLAFLSAFVSVWLAARGALGNPRALSAGALIAGLFYALNPWAIARVEHLGVLLGYAFLPLALALLLEAERRRSNRLAVAGGLTFVGVAVSPHYALYGGALLLLFLAVRLLWLRDWTRRRETLRRAALFVLTVAALEIYIVAPFIAISLSGEGLPTEVGASVTDLAARDSGAAWTDPLTLTANLVWHQDMRPAGAALLAWRLGGLVPIAALVVTVAFVRPLFRVSAALLVIAALAVTLMLWAESADARPALEALISRVPGARGIREPDKALGLLALAYAWGLGALTAFGLSASASWLRSKVRRSFLVTIAGLFLALSLTSFMAPAIGRFIWDGATAPWRPVELPTDYREVLHVVRADASASRRILAFESDDRMPSWDEHRVLRHLAARTVGGASVISSRAPVHAGVLALLERLPASQIGTAAAATGADRILVARDTRAGLELDARVGQAPNWTQVAVSDTLAYYRRADPPSLATAASAWTPTSGIRTLTAAPGPSAPVVVDGEAGRCHPALDALPMQSHEADSRLAARLACLSPAHLIRPRPASQSGWEYSDASPAGLSRWLQALEGEGLFAADLSYGLGFAWITSARTENRSLTVPLRAPSTGPHDVYVRVLAGDGAAALRAQVTEGQTTPQHTRVLRATGPPRFRWFRAASEVPNLNGDFTLRLVPSSGFGAVNAVAIVPSRLDVGVDSAEQDRVAQPPQVDLSRTSRTRFDGYVSGATAPFLLIVNETFQPAWRAVFPTGSTSPVAVGVTRMGFVVSETGDFPVQIEYRPQIAMDIGIAVSFASLLGVLLYLIWPLRSLFRASDR